MRSESRARTSARGSFRLDVVTVQIILLTKVHPAIRYHGRSPGGELVALDRKPRDLLVAIRGSFDQAHNTIFAQRIEFSFRIGDVTLTNTAVFPRNFPGLKFHCSKDGIGEAIEK